MANACSLFQDGGPHENDCTTSGNDATAITGDDAIISDRFSHFLSLYLRLLVFHHRCAMLFIKFLSVLFAILKTSKPYV